MSSLGAYRPWMGVFLLFWFMVINFADKTVLGLAALPIMREFRLSHTEFGLIGMSFFCFFSISSAVFGLAIGRLSAKWTLACMAASWSLCQLLAASSTSSFGLLVSRILLGLSDGAAYPIALYAAYRWFPDERRAIPTSLIAAGGAVGVGLVAPALSHFIVQWSWRTAFVSLATAGFLWCAFWMVVGHDGSSAAEPGRRHQRTPAVPIRALLTSRTVIGTQIEGFCAYWLLAAAVLWLPAYLAERFGLGLQAVGYILILPALCQIIVVPAICGVSQWLVQRGMSSRAARGRLAGLSVILAGCTAGLLPLLPGTALPILCVAIAFSVGTVIFVLGQVMVAEVAPPSQRGVALGTTNALITLGGPFASILLGIFADHGTSAATGFGAGFIVVGTIVCLGGIVGLVLVDPESDRGRLAKLAAALPILDEEPVLRT
jgi:MFS transporter, ACS family, D-galactonate transporter